MDCLSIVEQSSKQLEGHFYHGSKTCGLSMLRPEPSGENGQRFLYATTEPVFAAIFIKRLGGSLAQAWGRDALTGVPYLVERKERAIEANYAGQSGSVYAVRQKGFYRTNDLWPEEWITGHRTAVVAELRLGDVCDYLFGAADRGQLQIVLFRDRATHPAGSDSALIETAVALVAKYGPCGLEAVRAYQPGIYEVVHRMVARRRRPPRVDRRPPNLQL